jgi:hypothetical protein
LLPFWKIFLSKNAFKFDTCRPSKKWPGSSG